MTRYVLRNRELVPVEQAKPRLSSGVQIMRDIEPFKSPLEGHKLITSRSQFREELKANNCRQVDPSEWHGGKPHYTNPSFTKKRGLPLGY